MYAELRHVQTIWSLSIMGKYNTLFYTTVV